MKKYTLFMFIVVLFLSSVLSSCSQPEIKTPESAAGNSGEISVKAEPFSREDWDVCGFELWAEEWDLNARFKMQPTPWWDALDGCGHGFQFNGGSVSISSHWLLGKEYQRLYTSDSWGITVTDMSEGVALPRGLAIGCTVNDVERAFGLGVADEKGIYYGDGKNAPYTVKDGNLLTFAVPAGETDFEEFRYTCNLTFTTDGAEKVTGFTYGAEKAYWIKPGLPEPESVDEVRVFKLGESEPERVMSLEEAIGLLAYIQKAGRVSQVKDIMTSHSIEIMSGVEAYTVEYGEGLFIADGKIYQMSWQDFDMLYKSVPELRVFNSVSIRGDKTTSSLDLSEQQVAAVNEIVINMTACEGAFPNGKNAEIFASTNSRTYNYYYYFDTNYIVCISEDNFGTHSRELFTISDEDARTLTEIYNEIFKE